MPNNDTLVNNAVQWAKEHIGSREYLLMCLAFVEDAVEQSNHIEIFGGDSAQESADMYGVSANTGEPPKGAFVFYATHGVVDGQPVNWGHVGLCVGDGRVVHAWDVVREDDYLALEKLPPAPGWTPPRYIGYAPIERVLAQPSDRE